MNKIYYFERRKIGLLNPNNSNFEVFQFFIFHSLVFFVVSMKKTQFFFVILAFISKNESSSEDEVLPRVRQHSLG